MRAQSYVSLFTLVVILLAAGPWSANAQTKSDWLGFRGTNGVGVAESGKLPAEFGPTKKLHWKTTVPFGRSSPVVTADRIFLTASEGDKLITIALSRKNGRILWRRDVKRAHRMFMYRDNDPASPSPVSDGKNVFVFFAELGLISYDRDGVERWRLPLGPFNSFYGMAGSPVLASDTLVMVCDQRTNSFIVAVDARTGRVRWKTERSARDAYSTPAIYTPKAGATQVLVLGANILDAYSLETGERLWWVTNVGSSPKGVPVLGDQMVYISAPGADESYYPPYDVTLKKYDKNNDRLIYREEMKADAGEYEHFGWLDSNNDGYVDEREYDAVRNYRASGYGVTAIRLGGTGDVTRTHVVWRVNKAHPNIPAPLLYGGVLYLMKEGGIVSSLNPLTGEVLKTGRTPEALEEYYSSPVAADGKVFVLSASCKATVLKAGPQWEILAVNDFREECWATPAIAGNNLYIRTHNAMYSVGQAVK